MIRINLLPHREQKRERRKRDFNGQLVISAIVGGGIVFLGGMFINHEIENQNARNELIRSENQKLDTQIAEIKDLEGAIASLKARQNAVEDLQSDRTIPVHLFDELVKMTPEGVYLNKLEQRDMQVTLSGMAQSNERVAEFLRNRQLEFVQAARALGLPRRTIILRHILPNSLTPVLAFLPFRMSAAIVALASLDFLGLGVSDSSPSLGEGLRGLGKTTQ